ncbi:MAG: serine protease [Porticoccus sp.]|nr:serine protease [Porticoccus sp.]
MKLLSCCTSYLPRSCLLICLLLFSAVLRAEVWVIDIEGAIGPATADHMERSMEKAITAEAGMIVLRIDTPGGLDMAMREMIKVILASPLPVIGYVSPSGARAASAGTYLLYATHLAAMAPGTNLGAATPVQLGGGSPGLPSMPGKDDAKDGKSGGESKENTEAAPAGDAMERKVVNDAVAYIRSLAQLRSRNGDWAERAVREGVSLSANDALGQGVIELVADSMENLLTQLDDRQVTLDKKSVTLSTAGETVHYQSVDWHSEFLAVITNPNIAYILLMVGIYGLIIEFYNPGIGLPGIVGAASLLIAMYALQMLPISYAGMGLILLGIALMTAEAFAPSFGLMGISGAITFLTGSIMLMDTNLPAYQIALPMIIALTVFSLGLLVFALSMLVKARHRKVVTGTEHLIGSMATVGRVDGVNAWVWLEGELWHARSESPLQLNEQVRVTAIDGLTAVVSKPTEGEY